jgi:predicted nicotinamide N-methyase
VDLGSCSVSLLTVADVNDLLDRTDLSQGDPPYWAELWASSVGLARHLCKRADLCGRRALELGCGLGLAGIAAARAGASVLLTDVNSDAVAFALRNARRNGCRDVEAQRLSWLFPALEGGFDLVLGADVTYDPDHFEPIARLVERHLAPEGRAVFAEPLREVARDFFETMRAHGFTCARSVEDVELSGHTHRIGIAEFKRDRTD